MLTSSGGQEWQNISEAPLGGKFVKLVVNRAERTWIHSFSGICVDCCGVQRINLKMSTQNPPVSGVKKLSAALCYGVASFLIIVVNKTVLTTNK